MTDETTAQTAKGSFDLPPAPSPAGAYVTYRWHGDMVTTAGQIPVLDGQVQAFGRVGDEVSVDQAQTLAGMALRNALAVLRDAAASRGRSLEDLELVRIGVFVRGVEGFSEAHVVANGASEAALSTLGARGQHVRTAVGVAELPLGVPVEVEVSAVLAAEP